MSGFQFLQEKTHKAVDGSRMPAKLVPFLTAFTLTKKRQLQQDNKPKRPENSNQSQAELLKEALQSAVRPKSLAKEETPPAKRVRLSQKSSPLLWGGRLKVGVQSGPIEVSSPVEGSHVPNPMGSSASASDPAPYQYPPPMDSPPMPDTPQSEDVDVLADENYRNMYPTPFPTPLRDTPKSEDGEDPVDEDIARFLQLQHVKQDNAIVDGDDLPDEDTANVLQQQHVPVEQDGTPLDSEDEMVASVIHKWKIDVLLYKGSTWKHKRIALRPRRFHQIGSAQLPDDMPVETAYEVAHKVIAVLQADPSLFPWAGEMLQAGVEQWLGRRH
eukprot:3824049-Amphidinium_carterae.1